MTNGSESAIQDLIDKARCLGMIVNVETSKNYPCDRQVHNARLQHYPEAIVHCRDASDVSFWLTGLEGHDMPISVRSGGHHHEAMSVNDGGVVLSMDLINEITPDADLSHAWLGSGQRLDCVIKRLARDHRLLPTGGCATVCVGGLTQGGGWGVSYRTLGLTIDMLREVEMVLPNGDIVTLDKNGWTGGQTSLKIDPSDLFWALRGGGGGNFGVITRFRFELTDPPQVYTSFTLQWATGARQDVAEAWAALCKTGDELLNTFARMTVVDDPEHNEFNPSFIVGGRYYGPKGACRDVLGALYEKHRPEYEDYDEQPFEGLEGFLSALMLGSGPGPRGSDGTPLPAQAYALQVGARSKEKDIETCVETPEPHKVSSAIPIDDPAIVVAVAACIMDRTSEIPGVNMYLSWHGMGGRGASEPDEKGTAYPWRDAAYMLQVQAWWLPDSGVDEDKVLDWIRDVREGLRPVSKGAFINFPDRDQPAVWYYNTSWDRLRRIKGQVDPKNRLGFEMGIPPG